jgi:UTP-glucose-1-phosphate uridylyltransferase
MIGKTGKKITLVIMAAGIGSRFGGGIKQLEPVGPNGEIILDYSIYDAMRAGFNKVVFVIRRDLEKDFREVIGNRIEEKVEVAYAYQEVSDIPENDKTKFANRTKPWGTGQAVLACKDIVKEPFVVINADDYYGRDAYQTAYEYLTENSGLSINYEETESFKNDCNVIPKKPKFTLGIAMVSFVLKNTLSEFGAVTRGVCEKNSEGYLKSVVETANIYKRGNQAVVIEGEKEEPIDVESLVSMNMWCMFPDFFRMLEIGFEEFLDDLSRDNQEESYLKAEYLLPARVGELLEKGELQVKVLESKDSWFGVTYKADKEVVVAEINKLIEEGLYPNVQ